jgi:penicillin-binding protein 1A
MRLGHWVFWTTFLPGLLLFSILMGVGVGVIQGLWETLPEIHAPDLRPAVTTRLFDRNGFLLETIGRRESREKLVQLKGLPEHVKNAFIAIEDERFRVHFGIDLVRIMGALIIDIRSGRFAHGASTITQQLIRNVYLSPEKSIIRKLREVILALKMEYRFTKDEILEMYLNTVFFGGNSYGIESASLHYFARSSSSLSIAEVALLAGMLKAPNKYSPIRHKKRALGRQRLVLAKMLELRYITHRQYVAALEEEIRPRQTTLTRQENRKAPFFTQQVRKELVRLVGTKKMREGGLRVYTTLDWKTHEIARAAFLDSDIFSTHPLTKNPDLQGAFIVREVATGDVLALIGGRDFSTSRFNRATLARRQPGSCFKPFVYASAFEQGIPTNLIVNDEPISYYIAAEKKEWTPENYGGIYHGPSILRTALEHSYNVVAIRLLEKSGIGKTIALTRKMGIESYLRPDLTLALGSTEVTALELISAFSTFANQGIYTAPRFILRIEDSSGEVLYRSGFEEREAISEATAYKVFSMMQSVVANGSGRRARVPGLKLAGKTGTNQDYIDTWFVGMTSQMAALVTFGYNSRKSLGEKAPSSRVAAPVIGDFFRNLVVLKPELLGLQTEPKFPAGLVRRRICRVSGLIASSFCPNPVQENFDQRQEPRAVCPVHGAKGVENPYLD